MRIIRSLVILAIIAIIALYFIEPNESSSDIFMKHKVNEKVNVLESKVTPEVTSHKPPLEGELYSWVGKSTDELQTSLGEPERKDLSAYNYEWWVYTDHLERYIQFGIENETIKSIYAIGNELELEPVEIGQSYDSLNTEFTFENQVEYTEGVTSYSFKMTADDMVRRPLVKLTDNIFLQLYFDTFTNQLSSIRVMEAEILLRHRPYEINYRGTLPTKTDLTESEWSQVEDGMEKQIFDISNVLRSRFDKSKLEWEEEVSEVAFTHSKDMNDNNYFSHNSLNGDGLKERLAVTGLFYIAAGENIAARYPDAPSAVEGWLNSEGHREALLTEEYTHLGVGVYRFYYTQNFLAKPM